MKALKKLPRLPDFNQVQLNGIHEAQEKYEAIYLSHPNAADRYKELKKTYTQFAGIFNHAAENFYPDNYSDRQMRDSDNEVRLIELTNRAKGILDGLIFSLYAESEENPRFARDFAKYSSEHIAVCKNLTIANEVFIRRGALPEHSEGDPESSIPWRVARITASLFPFPHRTA